MQKFEKELAVLINKRASDLYILPVNDYFRLSYAEKGHLHLLKEVDTSYGQQFISYLKYQANMAISEHRRPQLGAINWQTGTEKVNLRLSSVGDYQGRESLVVRFIYQLTTKDFNLVVPHQWQQLQAGIANRGLALFAGPMGNGKTTTMYQLAKTFLPQKVILTIEDPVEIEEPNFVQLQVNELAGMDYQSLIRLGLRHRPDIFIIGEIRDPKTAIMAIQASLSGHLVLATVHARSVTGVIARLRQLGIDRYYLEQALQLICYQRLIPTVTGKQAVLWDILQGQPLQTAIQQENEGGMTNEWQAALEQAVKQQLISPTVAKEYQKG